MRAKYPRNSESSETRRNTAEILLAGDSNGTIEQVRRLTTSDGCENMADSVEEEELRCYRRLHEHDNGTGDDCKKSNYVHDTDAIEDDVAWTS